MSDSILLKAGEQEDFTLEPEDDLDAFNDETFGGEVDEWQEAAHEQLAELTEQERTALKASNDFFEFGSEDDEADCLEPTKHQNGGSKANQTTALNGGSSSSKVEKQFQELRLEPQIQVPLTIHTSLPANPALYPAQVLPQAFQLQPQQVPFNLVPPAHFQRDPLQDPAIMSFNKPPQPVQYTQHPMSGGPFPPPPPLPQNSNNFPQTANTNFPTYMQQPNANFAVNPSNYPAGNPSNYSAGNPNNYPAGNPSSYPTSLANYPPSASNYPPTVLGFKSMQDLENEMLYGARHQGKPQHPNAQQQQHQHQAVQHHAAVQQQQHQAAQQHAAVQQQHQAPQQHRSGNRFAAHPPSLQQQQQQQKHHQLQQQKQLQLQQQQQLLTRNLNYPGMRDRQQQQVFNNINRRDQNRPDHRLSENQQNSNWNNRDLRDNNQRNHPDNNRMLSSGDEDNQRYGGGGGGRHHDHHHDQHQRSDRGSGDLEEDSWRWNEVRNRNNDSATRKDLMPGHVHTLGILRHSRSRHHRDPEDDCLGDDAPLMNPTGDPLLDAKLSQEQAELASRCRYFNETEDEYSGLMTNRDKQFIINIQLSQLKCENPYVDDYYYTMYTAKKQHLEDPESTGQMLLSESMDHDNEYIPTQFENSLGKLQVVTVKAPRQIIDVGVLRTQETSSPVELGVEDPGLTVVKDTKRNHQDYKSCLLQLERVYSILLDLESLKLKLAAIPTGAPLREQVTLDLTKQIQNLVTGLNTPGLIQQFLQVRKGRGLLSRSLKHLPGAAAARVLQEMLQHLDLICKEKIYVENIWICLYRHLAQASLSCLECAMLTLTRDSDPAGLVLTSVLTSPLGVSTILAVLHRAATAAKRGQEKISVPVWRQLILLLISWYTSRGAQDTPLAAPFVTPQPLDIGFLLTLPHDKLHSWDAFLCAVGLDKDKV